MLLLLCFYIFRFFKLQKRDFTFFVLFHGLQEANSNGSVRLLETSRPFNRRTVDHVCRPDKRR